MSTIRNNTEEYESHSKGRINSYLRVAFIFLISTSYKKSFSIFASIFYTKITKKDKKEEKIQLKRPIKRKGEDKKGIKGIKWIRRKKERNIERKKIQSIEPDNRIRKRYSRYGSVAPCPPGVRGKAW